MKKIHDESLHTAPGRQAYASRSFWKARSSSSLSLALSILAVSTRRSSSQLLAAFANLISSRYLQSSRPPPFCNSIQGFLSSCPEARPSEHSYSLAISSSSLVPTAALWSHRLNALASRNSSCSFHLSNDRLTGGAALDDPKPP